MVLIISRTADQIGKKWLQKSFVILNSGNKREHKQKKKPVVIVSKASPLEATLLLFDLKKRDVGK